MVYVANYLSKIHIKKLTTWHNPGLSWVNEPIQLSYIVIQTQSTHSISPWGYFQFRFDKKGRSLQRNVKFPKDIVYSGEQSFWGTVLKKIVHSSCHVQPIHQKHNSHSQSLQNSAFRTSAPRWMARRETCRAWPRQSGRHPWRTRPRARRPAREATPPGKRRERRRCCG